MKSWEVFKRAKDEEEKASAGINDLVAAEGNHQGMAEIRMESVEIKAQVTVNAVADDQAITDLHLEFAAFKN